MVRRNLIDNGELVLETYFPKFPTAKLREISVDINKYYYSSATAPSSMSKNEV